MMYIKYLGNIYNIINYYSITKGGAYNNCIHLEKDNGHYRALDFKEEHTRDFVIVEIWKEIKKETKFYDLDEMLKIYFEAKKYNTI